MHRLFELGFKGLTPFLILKLGGSIPLSDTPSSEVAYYWVALHHQRGPFSLDRSQTWVTPSRFLHLVKMHTLPQRCCWYIVFIWWLDCVRYFIIFCGLLLFMGRCDDFRVCFYTWDGFGYGVFFGAPYSAWVIGLYLFMSTFHSNYIWNDTTTIIKSHSCCNHCDIQIIKV